MARALLAEFRKLLLSKRVFSSEGEKPDVGEGGGSDSSASPASSGSSGAAVSSGATQGKSAGDAVPARVMATALQVSLLDENVVDENVVEICAWPVRFESPPDILFPGHFERSGGR